MAEKSPVETEDVAFSFAPRNNSSLTTDKRDAVPASSSLDYEPAINIVLFFAVLSTNVPVLVCYVKNSHLRSNKFSFYLINLMTANIFHTLIDRPLDIAMLFNPNWTHSSQFCTLFLYAAYVSKALMMQCHVLITLNRVWAIAYPISYQRYHSKRAVILVIGCEWLFVHILLLPGILVDGLKFRGPADNIHCLLNTDVSQQKDWNTAIQVILYIAPVFIVVLSYPFIWWKRRKWQLLRISSHKPLTDGDIPINKVASCEQMGTVEPVSFVLQDKDVVSVEPAEKMAIRPVRPSNSFIVLSLLTASVSICWTPLVVFYTIYLFASINLKQLYNVAHILFGLQPVLDPILFSVALNDLRRTLWRMIKC